MLPDQGAELQAVHAGHVDIQQDQVRAGFQLFQRRFPGHCGQDRIAFGFQSQPQHIYDHFFIINHQNFVPAGRTDIVRK